MPLAPPMGHIVGGGIGQGTPFTVDYVPVISSVIPPQLASTDFMFTVSSGVNRGLIVGLTDPAAGPERLRVKGCAIIQGTHADSTCIGDGTDSGQTGQILIGNAITPSTPANIVAIGNSITVGSGAGASVTLGTSSINQGASVVIKGQFNIVGSITAVVIGGTTANTGTGLGHVNIGAVCSHSTGVVAVGCGTTVGGSASSCTVVGGSSTANGGFGCVQIGTGTSINTTSFNNCIAIGNGAQCWQTRMISFGSNASGEPPTMMALGHGLNTSASPTAFLIRLTNGSGTNNTAGALTLQAGLSTGNIVGPAVNLDAGVPGASSATLQTARTWVSASPTITATQTGLMLWDVDNATLERVTVGAADSGGAGFKVLRIPN